MATRGRDVLIGKLHYRLRKGNAGFKKKRGVCALAGMGGSNGGEGSKSVSAQILIYEDYEKVEKPGSKPKNTIRLDGAKIESSYSSPNASNTSSPAYSSAVTTPQGGLRLSASPSPSSASNLQNGPVAEFYPFTVATSTGEVHEFRVEMENDRLRWVKILQLLVMYPFSPIPEEPSSNPIKDSFRQSLEAKQYGADSVWPVYILPEEVGSKSGILGLHILALRSGVPNVSMGQLDIISPSDHSRAVVTWDRDKMRRTGKTGHLVFIEIGRRCEGGPGLVWMYTGYQNDAQALRETLHKFLFHGDGRAIPMESQTQSVYDVPRSLASVDSQPHSFNKRSSIPSGYHNHLLTRNKSQEHDSGYHSVGSGRTPPMLEGPPVRLDKHPSIRRKRDSDPCAVVLRRSNSLQSPCGSFTDKEIVEPMFECEDGPLSRHVSHSDSPPDDSEGYMTGHMDGEAAGRLYDVVRDGRTARHPHYTPHAVETDGEDEYMRMIHPQQQKYRTEGYVYMKPAPSSGNSPAKSSTIPVPMPQASTSDVDEYNTLQHFQGRQSVPPRTANGVNNYDYLPTIAERQHRDTYENHPLPQDLKGVMPRVYHPSYENHHEAAFRGRRGSHGRESYENVGSESTGSPRPAVVNTNSNNNQQQRTSLRRRSDAREDVSLKASPPLAERHVAVVE